MPTTYRKITNVKQGFGHIQHAYPKRRTETIIEEVAIRDEVLEEDVTTRKKNLPHKSSQPIEGQTKSFCPFRIVKDRLMISKPSTLKDLV